MSHETGFGHEVFDLVLGDTILPHPNADPGLLQQTFWVNLLPLYFNTHNGYHIATTTFNVPNLGRRLAHVDIYSHRSYNDIHPQEPFSHLHLRVICAPNPFVIDHADDDLHNVFLKIVSLDVHRTDALKPWQKPVIVISRIDADGKMFARPVEWNGNTSYILRHLQLINLCSDGGQADFHRQLVQWAEKGEFVEPEVGNDVGGEEEVGEGYGALEEASDHAEGHGEGSISSDVSGASSITVVGECI